MNEDDMIRDDLIYDEDPILVDIDTLTPCEYNPREHKDEIEILVNSIKRFKYPKSKAVDVNPDMVIINGHGRWLAAKKAGMKKIPVVIRYDLDEEEQMAWRIVDNQTSDLSGWNIELLDEQKTLLSASGWDLESFGLSLPEDYGWDDEDEEDETETVAPTEVEESHKLIVFCETQEEEDDVMAFALSKGITCQLMR